MGPETRSAQAADPPDSQDEDEQGDVEPDFDNTYIDAVKDNIKRQQALPENSKGWPLCYHNGAPWIFPASPAFLAHNPLVDIEDMRSMTLPTIFLLLPDLLTHKPLCCWKEGGCTGSVRTRGWVHRLIRGIKPFVILSKRYSCSETHAGSTVAGWDAKVVGQMPDYMQVEMDQCKEIGASVHILTFRQSYSPIAAD